MDKESMDKNNEVMKTNGTRELNDEELEQITGGFGHRRSFCGCFIPMPDGNGYCEQCGREIMK